MIIILKIFLGIFALMITIGSILIAYSVRKSMIDGNNIGNFIDEEEINHDSRKMMAKDDRLEEFINDINSQKDGGIVG